MTFFCWLPPRLKQWCWQQQESLLCHWPGHCLGHKNNFFSNKLKTLTSHQDHSLNLLSCQSLILAWTRRPEAVQDLWFSVSPFCNRYMCYLDKLGSTDSTKTAHGINLDGFFMMHNILSFKSTEDKEVTLLSRQTMKVWQRHESHVNCYMHLPGAYLVHCFQWCLHRWHAI